MNVNRGHTRSPHGRRFFTHHTLTGPSKRSTSTYACSNKPVLRPPVKSAQYTSHEFAKFCKNNKIRRSLGRTGICYDNAVAESFFASYKKELIHTRPWPNLQAVTKATFEWIEMYYNRTRRHSTLGYLTPHEYELGYRHIHELAA